MMRIFYLNINGFYGTSEKKRYKLKCGLEDTYCMKNAERICKQILGNETLKYDVIFFSEFAPNTPSGKWVSNYLNREGYKLILPSGYDSVKNEYYSLVVAYVKKELEIVKSVVSPNDWLTWCELSIDNKNIVGIHSTRPEFLEDMRKAVRKKRYKDNDTIILGDINVTEESEVERKQLMSEISDCVGVEIIDEEEKNTFRGIRKPDRVFSNVESLKCSVIDEFFTNNGLSDHDALSIIL